MDRKRKWNIEATLKDCPFCGGRPFLEADHRAFIKGVTTKVALVRCNVCNARTERFEKVPGGDNTGVIKAACEAWNRRAQ